MNKKTAKFIVNILLMFVFSSEKRKELRNRFIARFSRRRLCLISVLENLIKNNKLILIDENGKKHYNTFYDGLHVRFKGKNATVVVHTPIIFNDCKFNLGDDSTFEIEKTKYILTGLCASLKNKSDLYIDEDFSCCGCNIESHDEAGLKIKIGKDCLFSYGINIRTSDGHIIYDMDSKEVINVPKKGVNIGNHVWVGMNATILKDVSIGDNSVIGAKALVCDRYDEGNVVIAGVPAKIIKKNVDWCRENTDNAAQVLQ